MRPLGDVSQALLQALQTRRCRQATARELAHQAKVGHAAALTAIKNLRRAGRVHVVGTRFVAWHTKPVAVYGIEPAPPARGCADAFAALQAAWR